jgi:rhodanese-related sulfurtransferase
MIRPFARTATRETMSFIQNNWMLILVMFLSGAMLIWPLVQRRFSPMKDIGNLNVTHLINTQDAVLVDVRETSEYENGRLPNAIHIPLSQLDSRGAELAKLTARPVIAYCARGNRSRSAGAALARIGFKDIYNLHGGFRSWKDAGLPVEK